MPLKTVVQARKDGTQSAVAKQGKKPKRKARQGTRKVQTQRQA
jgi:hypothetical protein